MDDVVEDTHVVDAVPLDPVAAAALDVEAVDRDVVGVDVDGVIRARGRANESAARHLGLQRDVARGRAALVDRDRLVVGAGLHHDRVAWFQAGLKGMVDRVPR